MKKYIPILIYIYRSDKSLQFRMYYVPNRSMTNRPKGHMSWEIFQKIIDKCKEIENSIGRITIGLHKDGEPLLDPLLFKRIDYIKSKLKKLLSVLMHLFLIKEIRQIL